MNQCPHQKVRGDLPPLLPQIAALPVDERGYPVPFFVASVDGKPDFRVMDGNKLKLAIIQRLCWVCGRPLRGLKTFVIGPMCAVNRVSAEPPSHEECAEWSTKGCPFLSRPNMVRREDDFTQSMTGSVAGIMIARNPGVTCLWRTESYQRFDDGMGRGGKLFRVGPPERVTWWTQGRLATRDEVDKSITTGMPTLIEACQGNPRHLKQLGEQLEEALRFLPAF